MISGAQNIFKIPELKRRVLWSFALLAAYRIGVHIPTPGNNGQYNVPYMKGNDFWNVDLSLFKNFSIGGDKKLQLRMSGYNVFNHPTAYPDNSQNLTLRYDNGVMTSTDFGKLGNDFKFGRRIIQLAVRFTF